MTLQCIRCVLLTIAAAGALTGCGRDAEQRGRAALFDAPAGGDALTSTAAARPDIPPEAPTVVFLSDSIGAGLHLAQHEAFPHVLQRRLAADGAPFHLIDSSESGRTSAGGVTALDWVLASEPDVVVITLGGNDGLRGMALSQTERNLRTMIERARASGARVLLLGVQLPPNYGDYAVQFGALYPRLATDYGLDFVPFFMRGVGGVPEMNLRDGLHPTAAGHERLADNIEQALRDCIAATE